MSEWKTVVIGDFIDTNKRSITKDYSFQNIKYLDTGSITCNKIEGYQEFPLKDAPSRAKRLVEKQDIIYSSVRPNQLHYGYIENPQEDLVVSTGFVVISCNIIKLVPKYLYYYLSQKSSTEYLHSIAEASTSAYPSLKPKDIEVLEMELPPLPEQKAIAGVLSSLDDKIDLLHRQNKTLEAMAETLFRQWFVEEADEVIDNQLSDFCDVIDCLHSKKPDEISEAKNKKYLLQVYNIGEHGLIDLSTKYYVNDDDFDEWTKRILLTGGEIIISKTGRVAAMAQIPDGFISGIGRNLVAIKNKKFFTKEYLRDLLLSSWMKRKIHDNTSDGTILQSIHVKSIASLPVIVPDLNIMTTYSKIVQPMHMKINANIFNIIQLEKKRDLLLPKLMSGDVKVEI